MSTTDYRRTVTTQAELGQALADGVSVIDIRSEHGVWLSVSDTGSSTVRAWDSSTVEARDSSTVEALDSSTVEAWGFATVEAWGSATVRAWGFATVEAWDSSTVRAWDSSTVRAWDSSTVRAWDSSTVEAWDSSTVRASSRVAVHLHSGRATVTGGVVIDHTQEPSDPAAWCAWHDVPVTDGKALLYKAVGDDWATGAGYDYRPAYAPGAELEAPDWRDDNDCGGGLHLSPRTWEARSYHPETTRFVAVEVDVADLRPILGSTAKAKAPRCRVLHEVDIDGKPMGGDSDE